MLRQFRSHPYAVAGDKTSPFPSASPQKRARRRIIKSIGIRQFKLQQRAFISREMAGAV